MTKNLKTSLACQLVFFVLHSMSFAQEASIVTYKVAVFENELNQVVNPYINNKTKKFIKSIEESEFVLVFNRSFSIFKLKRSMKVGNKRNADASVIAGGIRYKNIPDNVSIQQKELLGEIFNIHHDLVSYDWKILRETKLVAGFMCYKAVAQTKTISFSDGNEKSIEVIAWFTPEIPLPFGPAGIDGLPGLVMLASANGGNVFFYVDKIEKKKTIEVKDFIDLKKGLNISEKDYLKLVYEKYLAIKNKS